MREYKKSITLTQNSRGIWSLDTTLGCVGGTKKDKKGCYSDCYAARTAKKYGYDFSKLVLRDFDNEKHLKEIKNKIKKVDLKFIRIGTNGDPSDNWEHTIKIIQKICSDRQLKLFDYQDRQIVIITRHWNKLTDEQLAIIKKYNICINTSISALDDIKLINHCYEQYLRLKPYCKSVLRVITADFNLKNDEGLERLKIQKKLLENENVIDTVFRVYKNSQFVKKGIINIHKTKFLGKKCYVSKYNKKTYFGKCKNCLEMCGINL